MRTRILVLTIVLSAMSFTVANAFVAVVTDPLITAKNAAIAALKSQILDRLTDQATSLRRMAKRLSLLTDLKKFAVPDPPRWRTRRIDDPLAATEEYMSALNAGDSRGFGYDAVTNTRVTPGTELSGLASTTPAAYAAIRSALATLDLADSTIIAGTDQTGHIRGSRRAEVSAIAALEEDVINPSSGQSATAVIEKLSGAGFIRARQQETRAQLMTAIVEQLLVDNKRERDTEAASMNMQLRRLQDGRAAAAALVAGTADDLRTWRQP